MTKRQWARPAEEVLADLDALRDQGIGWTNSSTQWYELWEELRVGDWQRSDIERDRQRRSADRAVLVAHGYKSIRAAKDDGWCDNTPSSPFVGGDKMELSRHELIKNYAYGYSRTQWRKWGKEPKPGISGTSVRNKYGSYEVFAEDQVCKIPNKERWRKPCFTADEKKQIARLKQLAMNCVDSRVLQAVAK